MNGFRLEKDTVNNFKNTFQYYQNIIDSLADNPLNKQKKKQIRFNPYLAHYSFLISSSLIPPFFPSQASFEVLPANISPWHLRGLRSIVK